MGGLVLDTKAGLKQGGNGGPVIVAGDPRRPAACYQALTYNQTELRMPPTGKLPDEKIAAFEKWIAAGAQTPAKTLRQAPLRLPPPKARHGYRNRPQVVGLPAGLAANRSPEFQDSGFAKRWTEKRSTASFSPDWSKTNCSPRRRPIAPPSSSAPRSTSPACVPRTKRYRPSLPTRSEGV